MQDAVCVLTKGPRLFQQVRKRDSVWEDGSVDEALAEHTWGLESGSPEPTKS